MKKKNKKIKIRVSTIARIIAGLFVLFFIFVFVQKLIMSAKTSDLFTIHKINYPPLLRTTISNELSSLKGKNIFSVNLKKRQERLQHRYPEISNLRIVRQFPNQILVTANERLPFAQVAIGGRNVIIDEEMTVLPSRKASAFILPFIEGLNKPRYPIEIGLRIKDKKLKIAVSFINVFRSSAEFSSHKIEKINISNLSHIYLHISGNIKVIVDQDGLDSKLEVLNLVLAQAKDELDSVKYIDLRFKEPILRKK